MDFEFITYEVADRIAVVTLNKPDRLNAWSPGMHKEIIDALKAAGEDPEVRVIVITGAGRAFSAGAEMDVLDGTDRAAEYGYESHNLAFMHRIAKPIIAAINGHAVGVAVCIAAFSDLRFIADGAKIALNWSRLGLTAEFGMAWLLPRIVGLHAANDMLLRGRFYGAADVARIGFAEMLPAADFQQAVREIALDVAQNCSPRSTAIIKRQVSDGLFVKEVTEAILDARTESDISMHCEDFREGVAQFVEKRAPAFTGR